MKAAQGTRAIDIAWVALLIMTFLMWWADSHAATDLSLLGMALVKAGLIAAVFMGLFRMTVGLLLGLLP